MLAKIEARKEGTGVPLIQLIDTHTQRERERERERETALWCIANVLGWLHSGQRLIIVGTIWKKLSKLVFTLYFQF